MVEMITNINSKINGFVWGAPAMVLILGVGLWLTIGTGFVQFRRFGYAMRNTIGKAFIKVEAKEGSVSPFTAMCTALAATVGTGNIAGVSGAIAIGGPGAVFWMWLSALFGMATKFSEVTLSIKYRERNAKGEWVGGPMYYIKNGLGPKFKWLGVIFAIFGSLAAFGIGNIAQVNTIASTVSGAIQNFAPDLNVSTSSLIIGVICAVLTAVVLLGGVKRIGDVCTLLVPVMAIIYIVSSLVVVACNIDQVPAVFRAIFVGAFSPEAAAGGLAGVGISTAIKKGVGRGIFSNEAGLGSAPIAHAAADVDHPVKQGIYGIFEVFADTIVICTLTAMVVLLGNGIEGIEYGNDIGAQLAINGMSSVFGGSASAVVVAVGLSLFAFSTVLSWGLYGTRCVEFLFGDKSARVFQILFSAMAIASATVDLKLAWDISDTLNGLMAIPNLIGVALLSPVVFKLTREYFAKDRLK
ncbi:MAG: sodium:alanine symporter family protein [Oscillospiraceae bacterium]|nr:sodium:alanine symporter family protein [Oscillospiraceae bacterium]